MKRNHKNRKTYRTQSYQVPIQLEREIAKKRKIELNPDDISPPGMKGHLPKSTEVIVLLDGKTVVTCKANGYSSLTSTDEAFLKWFSERAEGDELRASVDEGARLCISSPEKQPTRSENAIARA